MIEVKNLPPPADRYPIRRALISVFDKAGLIPFAKALHDRGIELVSTGGSARAISDAGIPVVSVSDLTGFPEILGGRVKTLHPGVHGGILSRRNDPDDDSELADKGIRPIDLVVVNLYPFARATAAADTNDAVAAENVDIGGPTMIRAAAKNFAFVGVVTEPSDYDLVIEELSGNDNTLDRSTRRAFARKAFAHTAAYDAAITSFFDRADDTAKLPEVIDVRMKRALPLRYGENPHQSAALYGAPDRFFEKLHGKDLSFNNLLDLDAALRLISEFTDAPPTVAILKHTNPCGVASSASLSEAYSRAFATDRQSPFGGIVVVNRSLGIETARAIDAVFTELIIAPAFDDGVLEFLQQKMNRRLIRMLPAKPDATQFDIRSSVGGLLVQEVDPALPGRDDLQKRLKVVTRRQPTAREWADLDFAWRVVKHVKSNAIVYAKDGSTIGVGAGQMSRIDSSETAVRKGAKSELDFSDSVVASDAFFPFADGLIEAVQAGARAAIQPGGSVRDKEVIQAADENGVAMVFTGARHFRH